MDEQTTRADGQFVTLGIDRELFAVPVEAVLEILDMRDIFHIPDAPAHLSGLIDVRGVEQFVTDLREQVKSGRFTPLPVRERMIPKASGKLRRLGIPTDAACR